MFQYVWARTRPYSPMLRRAMSIDLRQRSIVSSFICSFDNPGKSLKFALFKRSPNRSVYPGKWAVCSGSIEPTDESPLVAAKREVFEETKLTDSDITLLRIGKPYSLKDEALKTEWTIYPFAWRIKDGAEISLDAEHTRYRFITPGNLSKFDHVENLEMGMARVIVSPEMERALSILRNEKDSEDQAFILRALEILLDMVRVGQLASLGTSEEFWRELRWRVWHLAKNGRPHMSAAIENKLYNVLDGIKQELLTLPEGAGQVENMPSSHVKLVVGRNLEDHIKQGKQNLESRSDVSSLDDIQKLSIDAAEREEKLFGDL